MSNLILPQIASALSRKFVKWEKVGEVLSLGMAMKKPVVLYGRGGHGKSEMVRAVFAAIAESSQEFGIQSFGEGMTEAALYGGINLKALNDAESPRMEYYPERSFLNKKFFLFEELFDAPVCVLLALKDSLMSRQLNNGAQVFPMKTQLLVAATNKQPAEIADLGDSAQALTERFPLQLCVEWEKYEASDYQELLDKVEQANHGKEPVILPSSLRGLLAQMIADAVANGEWISPRQAVTAMDCVRASALLNDREEATEEDLPAIRFIPGTEKVLSDLDAKLERIRKVAAAESTLRSLEEKLSDLQNTTGGGSAPITPIKLLQTAKRGQEIERQLGNLSVPDQLVKRRDSLRQKVSQLIAASRDRAMELTNV